MPPGVPESAVGPPLLDVLAPLDVPPVPLLVPLLPLLPAVPLAPLVPLEVLLLEEPVVDERPVHAGTGYPPICAASCAVEMSSWLYTSNRV